MVQENEICCFWGYTRVKDKFKNMKHNQARQFTGAFSAIAYATWRDMHLSHVQGYIVSDSFMKIPR